MKTIALIISGALMGFSADLAFDWQTLGIYSSAVILIVAYEHELERRQ